MPQDNPLLEIIRRPDLSVLGSSIKKLPVQLWETRMFFAGVQDKKLKQITTAFPATFRKDHTTHPIFVLAVLPGLAHTVCPCSSKGHTGKQRYIACGCLLEMRETVMDRDSFLVEKYAFPLPDDHSLSKNLFFLGRVPEHCLHGRGRKE